MYCKLRIEFSHPVLRPERKACQTVLVVFLLYYALVQFLWKLFSRKIKVSCANADQNFDNFRKIWFHLTYILGQIADQSPTKYVVPLGMHETD